MRDDLFNLDIRNEAAIRRIDGRRQEPPPDGEKPLNPFAPPIQDEDERP